MLFMLVILSISCSSDKRVFDEQGEIRMDEQIQNIELDLQEAEDGWIMRYYPDEERVGGYVFLFDFSENTVLVKSDINADEDRSSYKVYGGEGPVLSFDEYNALHILADPVVQPFGVGYKGDFEFIVMKSSADSIVLKGRKWNKKVVMYPASPNDWDKISKLRENEAILAPQKEDTPFYRNVYINGLPAATFLYQYKTRFLEYFYKDENGIVKSGRKGVSFTNDGFELQTPININGTLIESFTTNETLDGFSFQDNGILKIENNAVLTFTDGWKKLFDNDYIALSQVSPDYFKIIEEAREQVPDFSTIVLYWGLGTKYLKTASFIFDDRATENRNIRYYHASIGAVDNPAEDQGIFIPVTSRGNYVYYLGGNATTSELEQCFIVDSEKSASFKKMADLFFQDEGYTIIPNADGNYYLVSNLNSNYWMLFVSGN